MKKNRKKTRIIAIFMAAVTVFMLLPLTVSAVHDNCNHSYGGARWADAVHPHEYYYYCEYGCGAKEYIGSYMTKTNCAICNPSIGNCSHPGGTWMEGAHPHPIVCTSCSEVLSYGTASGCADCCINHSGYTFYEEEHFADGSHNMYLHCDNCGSTIYQGVTYNLASCEICNPPLVSSVSLYASSASTTIYSSGILEATALPASFSVYANCENCWVTSLYYYDNGIKVETFDSFISYTASSYDEFQSLTFYVETNTGVTDSISVNFNYARYAESAIKWDYEGIVVRSITQDGRTIRSGLSTTLEMDWNSDLTDSDYNTIADLVGAYDGKTYVLTGSTLIRVYKPSTGETLAVFDTYNEFDDLCNFVMWSNQTLNAFESTRVNSLSYQSPMSVEGRAQWVTTDGEVLHTQTAAQAAGCSYIKPKQSITVTYFASTYMPAGYTIREMSWECGSDIGTSTSKTSYSTLYNYTTSPVNATFIIQKMATSGSLLVRAYDVDTLQPLPEVTIICGTRSSTSNPAIFSGLSLGTYYPEATAPGYDSASGSVTLSGTDANKELDLLLSRSAGEITVYVFDRETNEPISDSTISGTASGVTDLRGCCVFKNVTFGTNLPFYASANGYNSGSGTATVSKAQLSDTVVIYLDPIPQTGDINVSVVDSETRFAIADAYVSGCAQSGYTNYYGEIAFYDVQYGGYNISASANGYYSGEVYTSISNDYPHDSVTIYLDPIPTTGDITVRVIDSETGDAISGAYVSEASLYASTDANGYVYFCDIPFGMYSFTVGKTGYYSDSITAEISFSENYISVTIYLDPIPTRGDITVYVMDKDTGFAISGASVSGGGRSGITNSSGYIKFADLDFRSYTFTASADGYSSGTGSVSINVTSINNTITIYLEKTHTDLTPDVIINGDIYKGSAIIVSAEVFNDGDIDLTPDKAATVTMTARRNGGAVFDTQAKTVIIPAYDRNLVWFTVNMPKEGYTSSNVSFEFKVSAPPGVNETVLTNNTDSISKTVVDLPNRNCSDPGLELDVPSYFTYSKYSSNSMPARTWSVYEWNGGFVRKTYTAKLVLSASLVPDSSAGHRKQYGGIWTTRSGYGINTEVSVSVNGGSDIAGFLKVDIFYPEYNYSTVTNKSDRLELVGGKYVFKSNGNTVSGSRMHAIPLWFPDKAYAVKYYAYDLWCPGGMLYGYTNAYVNIDGDMYDDLYTN